MNKKIICALLASFLTITVFTSCGAQALMGSPSSSSVKPVSRLPASKPSSSSQTSSSSASSFPDPDDDPLYQKAYADYAAGKYDDAVGLCNNALAANQNCFWAYNLKGISIYFANGNSYAQSCLDLINKSIAINPNYSYGYFNKGLIQKGLGKWDDSVSDFNKVLELKPGDTWSYYGIATVYADSGKEDSALQYLKLAIDTNPAAVKAQVQDDMERHFSKLKDNADFKALIKQ